MKMKNAGLALLSAATLASAIAAAQTLDVPPGKWWKRPAVVRTLGLTEEQQDKLDQIFLKNRKDFVDLKADVEKKQIDVEDLMAKRDSDPKKVSAAIDLVSQSRAKLRKATAMMILEMRGVLTDEQWKQVMERRDQWRSERRDEMRGMMRGGPGGPGPRPPASGNPPQTPPASRPPDTPEE